MHPVSGSGWNSSADGVVWLAIITHCCEEGHYCHGNPWGCHIWLAAVAICFFSCANSAPQLCLCMSIKRNWYCMYRCVCTSQHVFANVCVHVYVFIMHLLVHHVSCVTMCACNLQRSLLPGSITPLLHHDKCEVLWCMCGLKMKQPTGRYCSSTFCFQTHHYRYGCIDCLLGFLFFLCACFVLFSSQLAALSQSSTKMTLTK